jgi:hypothetical protein
MFSSSAATAARAMTSASHRTPVEFAGRRPGTSRRQSEDVRSLWESPWRGAYQAAQQKRAGAGGREAWNQVSDGLATDRSGRPCTVAGRCAKRSIHR